MKALIQEHKDEQAVSQLIDFIIDTYEKLLGSYPAMPPFANDKSDMKARIRAIMK